MPQYNSDVTPDVTGRKLGYPDQRYDANLRNIDVSGIITGDFTALAINKLTHAIVAFNANPVFAAAQGTGFYMLLTGNVISSTITGLQPGVLVAFVFQQDSMGGRTFTWPVNVSGGAAIGQEPNEKTAQLFYSDGVNLYALTPGVIQ